MDVFLPNWREEASEIVALRIEAVSLACPTHRACPREPGDCCVIGSVIAYWDRLLKEHSGDAERIEAECDHLRKIYHPLLARADRRLDTIAKLRAVLFALREYKDSDGPCWCGWRPPGGHHSVVCLQARAALAGCDPTPAPEGT